MVRVLVDFTEHSERGGSPPLRLLGAICVAPSGRTELQLSQLLRLIDEAAGKWVWPRGGDDMPAAPTHTVVRPPGGLSFSSGAEPQVPTYPPPSFSSPLLPHILSFTFFLSYSSSFSSFPSFTSSYPFFFFTSSSSFFSPLQEERVVCMINLASTGKIKAPAGCFGASIN